jgi:hypothetical protein
MDPGLTDMRVFVCYVLKYAGLGCKMTFVKRFPPPG